MGNHCRPKLASLARASRSVSHSTMARILSVVGSVSSTMWRKPGACRRAGRMVPRHSPRQHILYLSAH